MHAIIEHATSLNSTLVSYTMYHTGHYNCVVIIICIGRSLLAEQLIHQYIESCVYILHTLSSIDMIDWCWRSTYKKKQKTKRNMLEGTVRQNMSVCFFTWSSSLEISKLSCTTRYILLSHYEFEYFTLYNTVSFQRLFLTIWTKLVSAPVSYTVTSTTTNWLCFNYISICSII